MQLTKEQQAKFDQQQSAVKPASQAKSSRPASTNLPSLVKVEKGHALAGLKAEMAGRQEFYEQVTDMRIQHIDHCEAQSDAAVIAHLQDKQGEGFLDSDIGMDALLNEFMSPISLVAVTEPRSASLPLSSLAA
jgi:hypothetical protein